MTRYHKIRHDPARNAEIGLKLSEVLATRSRTLGLTAEVRRIASNLRRDEGAHVDDRSVFNAKHTIGLTSCSRGSRQIRADLRRADFGGSTRGLRARPCDAARSPPVQSADRTAPGAIAAIGLYAS